MHWSFCPDSRARYEDCLPRGLVCERFKPGALKISRYVTRSAWDSGMAQVDLEWTDLVDHVWKRMKTFHVSLFLAVRKSQVGWLVDDASTC